MAHGNCVMAFQSQKLYYAAGIEDFTVHIPLWNEVAISLQQLCSLCHSNQAM